MRIAGYTGMVLMLWLVASSRKNHAPSPLSERPTVLNVQQAGASTSVTSTQPLSQSGTVSKDTESFTVSWYRKSWASDAPGLIPRTVWQTFSTNRFAHKASYLASIREINPEYDFRLINDSAMDSFMQTFTDIPGVREAYFAINPAIIAAKTDVWRYAVLYHHGGVYIDIDSSCTKPLRTLMTPTDRAIVSWAGAWHRDTWKDWWDKVGYTPEVDQWCLFAAPKHPVVRMALKMAVTRINEVMEKEVDDMHELVLTTTGPKLWMAAMDAERGNPSYTQSLREMHEDFNKSCEWKVLGFRDKTLDKFAPKSPAVYYWDAAKGTVFASKSFRKNSIT